MTKLPPHNIPAQLPEEATANTETSKETKSKVSRAKVRKMNRSIATTHENRGIDIGNNRPSTSPCISSSSSRPNALSSSSLLRLADERPRPEPTVFRRCSIRMTKQKKKPPERQSRSSVSSSSSSRQASAKRQQNIDTQSNVDDHSASRAKGKDRRRPRRSSLKKSSSATTKSTALTSSTKSLSSSSSSLAISASKIVSFNLMADVHLIEPMSKEDLRATWMSREERSTIHARAQTDLKILNRMSKIPKEALMADPTIREIRASISIRGLEQFTSKSHHRLLCQMQYDHLWAVLDAQDRQREQYRTYGHVQNPNDLAKVSSERSLASRKQALRQGKKDEEAVLGYLGRASTHRTTTNATIDNKRQKARRRASMPSISTKTKEFTETSESLHNSLPDITVKIDEEVESAEKSSRSLPTMSSPSRSSVADNTDNTEAESTPLLEPFVYPRRPREENRRHSA